MIVLRAGAIGALLLLAACAAGPDYRKPVLDLPLNWAPEAPWRASQPADAAAKGAWWQVFADPQLDALEQLALAHNATLAQAQARRDQARASLGLAGAAALPQIGLNERAARLKISENRPLTNYKSPNFSTVQNELNLSLGVSYELDLAGRVQRTLEGAQASLQQSAADLENTRLLLTAELANNYFNLRASDTELAVLARSIALQQRALDLVGARHDLGAATGLDLAQQQALLDTTRVQVDLLRRQREQYEHAVATLAGIPAPQFRLAPDETLASAPQIPLGLPSELLQRRPDIAAAERAMAAANAQIGVASAAFYPSLGLGGAAGVDSRTLTTLFEAPSILWSLGASAAQTLFDGGRVQAGVDVARAAHAAASANYRRVVLLALQEAQDGISGVAALQRASAQSQAAVATAQRVLGMANARYEGGASSYFEVISAQQSLLASERQAAQLLGQQMLSAVFLIKALGGGWQGLEP